MRNHGIPFDDGGIVRLAVKQGKPEKRKKHKRTEQQTELIEVCLNCKKEVCRGCDKKFKEHKKITDKELS